MSGSEAHSDDDAGKTIHAGVGIREKDFFETLVENGSDAIVSIDTESRIIFANRSVERVFGYAPTELVGEPLTRLMPDRFRESHHRAIGRYLRTGERNLDWNDIQLPAVHADGHEIQLSITFEEHEYDGERVFSGIMRDVTERVERKRELERQNERLERFASIVSHDLRDPLQAAKANLAIAEAELGDAEILDETDAKLDRMEQLIDDVLVLAKEGREVGDTREVDVTEVAEDAWATGGRGDASLRIENPPTVESDPERLRTVLENLFRNAVEHAGTAVTVEVGALQAEDGKRIGFYVADDGPGFGDADPASLFDHGYTTSENGTGFGLSIVAEIATAHGWEVRAVDDDGARFEFEVGR